ncbi:ketoacyl reductase [Ktedonobacter sp. SOSP1-52]|uniref:SDR family NAD(P)-dependent oxidoreductase n=1 Tax=Ktedonobacter sp. SOSP1-52 TaxID=2778366 RepID=UPI0019151D0C|nr:SDR family NAD(P)-dependent oxidoreductase [Ktedonobacter sp. SOSP1-52]GHO70752.1 ketoacyl reductase [Ktedonobacter sp. SOSP1-52]
MSTKWSRNLAWAGIGLGASLALRTYIRRSLAQDLQGQVVVITGGSRGLGLAMAREFARQGCRLALCAREAKALEVVKEEFTQKGVEITEIYIQTCDVSKHDQVDLFVSQVLNHFGRIDILVNNAGVITVGPQKSTTIEDYAEAMDIMYWGMVNMTFAVLPHMRERASGRIVNITSIGGKVSVPHLLPYSAAKFAAVGFSEGMHAELAQDGITVTTVVPGLMRTGSHIHAYAKGDKEAEYAWFAMGATYPFISMQADRAARKIVDAARLGEAEVILSPQAKLLAGFHGLFPGLTSDILSVVNRLMPKAPDDDDKTRDAAHRHVTPVASFISKPGEVAIHKFNQESKQD